MNAHPGMPPVSALAITVTGTVQGVGFRPFVARLAHAHRLAGWVRNAGAGVEIHVEGDAAAIDRFVGDLRALAPAAARVVSVGVAAAAVERGAAFTIQDSDALRSPTTRVSPDLPVCDRCLAELFDPSAPRFRYPYITCTDCGPRYSLLLGLPFDRARTTMAAWPLDERCAAEYGDRGDRRFHAQALACPVCGPAYRLEDAAAGSVPLRGDDAVRRAAALLAAGRIVAVKGVGGYHLACDARDAGAVAALRARKFRKEQPFALMARDLDEARRVVDLSPEAEGVLTGRARPIVVAPARTALEGIAPDDDRLGVMLPYAPIHALLFASGAPPLLVMTSGNRSSEPIAFDDEDARQRLAGIADALLAGERPIARRIDDSIVHTGVTGPVIVRRARGYAPDAVAALPANGPLLAVGADLKNTIALVVDGQAVVSQHLGDLSDARSLEAHRAAVRDLLAMYRVDVRTLIVAHDAHPEYASTAAALDVPAAAHRAFQHHRAHVASVLAERGEWSARVLGVAFDGTGLGDDGSIWGGEIFCGSLAEGFARVAHLTPARLPGGDAAARHPARTAAGFLAHLPGAPDLMAPPFSLGSEYGRASRLAASGIRTFATTSVGRLFDAAAALLGFTRPMTFEGQAAMWLEARGRRGRTTEGYPFPLAGRQLDYRPLLGALIQDRLAGRPVDEAARAFHRGLARGLADALRRLGNQHGSRTVVVSGGVFQNDLLMRDLRDALEPASGIALWSNEAVPPNDGGISLGQAALLAFDLERTR